MLSEGGATATASTTSLRALQIRLGSVNRCSRAAVLLKTRGGDPHLVSCKVAGRSHHVRESCTRANMEEKTASTAVSSHELPSLAPALTTRATRLGAHNPVCDSYMCDWLTGRHGPARWQPVELPCTTQSTFTTTISYFLLYLCFVSALSQSITAFRRPVERNLQRISWITPRWRLRDSSDALLQGMGHEPPTNKEDYRWKSRPVRSNSIERIAHFRSL